ncbi:MAG TPA: lytic transglycosylase domain-containing protein, partial [Allosphingosinicella sp.]|nr:lytic transglycosylase domain-containing protein [Allosphingosinicella sp.]
NAGVQARHARAAPVPPQLTPQQRSAYRAVLDDLAASNWASAAARLDAIGDGPLHDLIRAQLFTLPGTPPVEMGQALALLAKNPELPQAAALASLAQRRGATALPSYPQPQRLLPLSGQPRRERPRSVASDSVARELDALIKPLTDDDRPGEAEALLLTRAHELTPEGRAELLQKIAWTYYREGFHRDALRVASEARQGPGDWALQAEWVAGLAAWQIGDCTAAENSFLTVGRRAGDPELAAAGHYWASRAALRCRHPERVQAHLRAAARSEETFYGLLAETALGLRSKPAGEVEVLTAADWASLSRRPNVRAAVALLEAGEHELADTMLRHQARIGPPSEHVALTRLAARLNLPATQMFLAHNGPRGVQLSRHDRYPAPDWRPEGGSWQVDQALAYAHALQESNFRPAAVSQVGARGLMQVRPGTAGDLVRWGRANSDPSRLNDPAVNLAFGQAYLGYLRDQPGMEGLLPRIVAAYNAGPVPAARWTAEGTGNGDPLLYIESLSYWETRGYIPIILRNYWMYEHQPANVSTTRRALTQGMWPRFPGMPGPSAVRLIPTPPLQQGTN